MLPFKRWTAGYAKVACVERSTADPGSSYDCLKMSHLRLSPSPSSGTRDTDLNRTSFAWVKQTRSASHGLGGERVLLREETMQMPALSC